MPIALLNAASVGKAHITVLVGQVVYANAHGTGRTVCETATQGSRFLQNTPCASTCRDAPDAVTGAGRRSTVLPHQDRTVPAILL